MSASYLARRAAQKQQVRLLYRKALKDTLNWAVHRHLFYEDADELRKKFEANRNVEDPDAIDRIIAHGEATYNKFRHPDPYFHGLLVAQNSTETQLLLLGLRLYTTMAVKTMPELSNPSQCNNKEKKYPLMGNLQLTGASDDIHLDVPELFGDLFFYICLYLRSKSYLSC